MDASESHAGKSVWEDEVVESHEARLPPEELEKIQKWLQPTDYEADSSEYRRHLISRTPGTGSWLWETEPYQRWRESPHHGGLWIKGVPGAGKSVLAASMVDHLRTTESDDTPILFFFFRHIILANRHPKSLMRDWLAQLLPHSLAVQGTLQPMVKTGRIDSVSDNVLWDCVLKGLEDVPRAFCVADALDEMETTGSEIFFQRLNRLATFSPAKVKLFMTSRPRQDLQSCLSATSTIHISLEEEKVGREIEVFIRHRLSDSTSLSESDQSSLAKAIASRSRGLFLYARLLIDQVLPQLKSDGSDIDIQSLPLHLEDMYNEMLARQAEEVGVTASTQAAMLGLITHATRPLRLRELAGFLEQEHGTGPLDKSKNIARFACHPLVQILEDETVQVIHHSFTEYLLDASRSTASPRTGKKVPQFTVLNPVEVHRDLAIACIKAVTATFGTSTRSSEREELAITRPFLTYAQKNILAHASHQSDIVDEKLFDAIESISRADKVSKWKSPLHFAAEAGLSALVHRIINAEPPKQAVWPKTVLAGPVKQYRGELDEETEDLAYTPFGIACWHGHFEIMRMIWEKHPKEFSGSLIPFPILEETVTLGLSRELKFLLDLGLHVDQKVFDSTYGTARIMKLLCDTNVECLETILPSIPESSLPTLFCNYASAGHAKLMGVLMAEKAADATWKNENGTVLHQVCAAGKKTPQHVDCIKMLLPSVADISMSQTVVTSRRAGEASPQPQHERTVLHALAGQWYDGNHEISVEMFEILLQAGAQLEARDGKGDTPVLCLFPQSFNKSVQKPLKYLLEAGADVNARDNDGASLIHRAVRHHLDITLIETLLDHGADINALWRRYGRDPAMPALALFWDNTKWNTFGLFDEEKGHEIVAMNTRAELAAFMVKRGATIDAGGDAASVLGSALQCCDIDTFKLLITARSEDSSIDKTFFSFRYHFDDTNHSDMDDDEIKTAQRDPVPYIKALISAGASIEARDDSDQTPLMDAVENKTIFDTFLRTGADINAADYRGRGMLYSLVQSGKYWSSRLPPRLERLRDLVKLGCDPLTADQDGVTLLHLAVTYRPFGEKNYDFVQQLVDYGCSPRARTRTGLTPLHMFFHPEHQPSGHRDSPSQHVLDVLHILQKASDGVDIDAQDEEGITPLHMAAMLCCYRESFDYVHALLESGADPKCLSHGDRSVLHLAARARNPTIVGYLTDRVPELVHYKDADGRTPLFDACISGVVESVASLIRAGADVSVHDNQGWTPLHACAESEEEQRQWTKNERALNAGEEMKLDRYRPYKPPFTPSYVAGKPGQIKFTPYLRLKDRGGESGKSYIIENTELAMISITDLLLHAGAGITVAGGNEGLTPGQRASQMDCRGMLAALERHVNRSNKAQISDPSASKLAALGESEKEAVLQSPWQFVSQFSMTDIAWLKQQDANLFCTVDTDDQKGSAKTSFIRIHSCIETVALAGVTEFMVQLGGLACRDETPNSAPIDRWTLDLISRNVECETPPNSKHDRTYNHALWKPDQIKTVSDYLHPTDWEVSPLLHIACLRTEPNMEMLKVLVEVCCVDVNGLTTCYCAESEHKEKQSYATTLQHLASSQCFWHLEAIRYLVYMGADVDARDKYGSTALHFACGSKGILSLRFVELLLELGADPKLANDDGITSVDLATSPQKLQLLGQYGIDISKTENESLWLGVGELNIELVQMALDSGVDVNRRQDSPVYTRRELEWDVHSTALSARCAAVPLAGALLYSDYLQVQESPAGEDLRAAMIRLLLDNGADPFQPYWTQKYHEDDQGRAELVTVEESPLLHYVFRAISCKKKYLELLLEYGDRLDFDRRDGQGNTVFLAACASHLRYLPPMAFRLEYSPTSDDAVDYEAEKVWDSGGLFLNMLDYGADITATNNDGDNALHILLSNPCVLERHILRFLENPQSHPLVLAKDSRGFTCLQLAFKTLRPATIEVLLSLGASLTQPPLFDPDGYSPLHRIVSQCFTRHIPVDKGLDSRRLVPRSPDFLASCKKLWRQCLDVEGLDINAPDATPQGNPPLLHYLSHHADCVHHPSRYTSSVDFKHETTCHVDNFDDFFGDDSGVDLRIKNNIGDGALHIVAWNETGLDGETLYFSQRRSVSHDANVMRFLVTKKGLDPLVEDAKGRSSLDLAAQLRREKILEVFRPKN